MAAAKKPAAAKPAGAAKKVAPASSSKADKAEAGDANINFLLEGMREAIGEENAMLLGADSVALKIRGVISTRIPCLDEAIGRGGIPLGRVTMLVGGEGSGKTTICLQLVAEAQSLGGWAVYFDNEHKLDPDYAEALGVDKNRLIISQPDTVEQFFSSANKLVDRVKALRERDNKRVPVIVVLDSINSAIAKAVFEGEGNDQYGPEARVWSKELPRLNKRISREDIALVLISQVRDKIGVLFGDKIQTGGGNAPRFFCSLIMKVMRVGGENEDGVKVANKTEVVCTKNQISPPFRKAMFLIRYGKGADFARSLLLAAARNEIISKSGSTYYYGETKLGVGEGASAKMLKKKENRPLMDKIYDEFRKKKGWDEEGKGGS
jgi:recombination protein RecA